MRSSLKLAREAINNKDFNAALSYAEAGIASEDLSLDHEKTSNAKYTLLVFKALALHNLGHDKDAIETYETAALLHPNQPLAWQVQG